MANDTISRQAAIANAISGRTREIDGEKWIRISEVRESIKTLPSAERHGRWTDVKPAPNNLFYATCSVCGERQTVEVANFCPFCGADMGE